MKTTDQPARKRVHVAVGVIYGTDGRILIAQRSAEQHLGGLWEFPGGKVETGETVNDALVRELHEELGIKALSQSALCCFQHDYDDKSV
ncbi:MAG: NUDIX domain-containing protein, partial [Pseudohongiella sp.]|nr:NUDIX domain-containing protein [Pseudohongiella sp.]